jgi:hypothetical protein
VYPFYNQTKFEGVFDLSPSYGQTFELQKATATSDNKENIFDFLK